MSKPPISTPEPDSYAYLSEVHRKGHDVKTEWDQDNQQWWNWYLTLAENEPDHKALTAQIDPHRDEADIDVDEGKQLTRKKMDMTLNVMANSLLYWTQDILHEKLFAENSRIFALTSAGAGGVMQNYGAVSVAKSALEAYVRQLAVELAPYKITVNALMPGTTNTPAGNVIPGFDQMLHFSKQINPYNRNTEPIDIAKVIELLSEERSYWITGQIIHSRGGM